MPSPPCGWRGRRSRSRLRTPSGCSGRRATPAVQAMGEIVDGCKALSFRLARRREFDPEPLVTSLAGAWERALGALTDSVG